MSNTPIDALEKALGMPPLDLLVMHKPETMAYKFLYRRKLEPNKYKTCKT